MSSQHYTQANKRVFADDARLEYPNFSSDTLPGLTTSPSALVPSNEAQAWPIAASRMAVPVLALPSPEAVPSRAALDETIPEEVLELCRAALARRGSRQSRAIAALGSRVPGPLRSKRSRCADQLATSQPADPETHDEFFRVRRCDSAPAERFLLGLLKARQVLRRDLEETMTSLPDARLAILSGALESALRAALGTEAVAPLVWTRREGQGPWNNAGRRWIRGHQIFAVLSQSMIFALTEMERAANRGDAPSVGAAADLMAELLAASAVSLELTGDFSESYYREVVRVGMESPFLPRGFSGLLSSDHRHLVAQMKRLRPTIDRLREQQPDRHARIVAELGAVYASHKHVCARFVGAEQSSLLMANSTGRSAVAQIDRFRAMRLRSWEPATADTVLAQGRTECGR